MATLPYMFVCLCCFFSVNSEIREIVTDSYDSEIAAVLNYLNSTPFRVYNYKEAILLNAHKKSDITELALDVHVDCINNYPDVPCSKKTLTCSAFVQKTPEKGSQVLNDVNCKPKPEIVVDEPTLEPVEVVVNETKSIALSNEAVSSEVGEPFVAIRKNTYPCLGCPFDLNPEAEGVDELIDIALEHVGSERDKKQTLVKVLKLQQQVVSGVKYYLVVEIAPTVCVKDADLDSCPQDPDSETYICEIVYLQKPWISKAKHVISNNCTVSQEYVRPNPKRQDISNEIDSNSRKQENNVPNFDQIAESGTMEQMSPPRLLDLESQIIVETDDAVPKKTPDTQAEVPSTAETFVDPGSVGEPTTEEERPKESSISPEEQDNDASEDTSPEDSTVSNNSSEEANKRTRRSDESPESIEGALNSTISDLGQAANSSEEASSEEAKTRVRRSDESPESVESDETHANTTAPNAEVAINSSEESSEETKGKVPRVEETTEARRVEETSDALRVEEATEARVRRAIPQLEKISPEEKGLVRNLADFAAAALDNIDDDNHKRIILQILGAKKMVGDDGVYYHLIMRMGVSRCLEDKPLNPYENCREKLFENYTKICKVQVYVNDDFGSPKVVKSQCQNIKRDKNDSNRTNYSRFKREVLDGGQSAISKDDDKVKELLRQGVTHLNAQSNKNNKYKPLEVISATQQVVAGVSYRIKVKIAESDCSRNDPKDFEDCGSLQGAAPTTCEIKVWEKSWENFRQFKVKCENGENFKVETGLGRSKRQTPRGGRKELDGDDENVKELLGLGLAQLNAKTTKDNKYKPLEVISATQQVVAGSIYRIKVKVSESDCTKNDQKSLEECNAQGSQTVCEIEVWEKAWKNFRRFTVNCENGENLNAETEIARSKRSVPGGQSEIDKNGDDIKELLSLGVTHLNAQTPKDNKYKPLDVISATKQVVAGFMYRIKVKVAESDCSKKDRRDLDDCNVREDASPTVCEVKVWEKGWENFRQFAVTCENGENFSVDAKIKRRKRDVGESRQLPKRDPFVDDYLESGLSQLDSRSPHDNKLKVDEILSVTKQTVSGHIYNIKAKIVLSDCDKLSTKKRRKCGALDGAEAQVCSFRVYEALWRPNSRTINITCGEDEYSFGTIHKGLLGDDDPTLHFTLFNAFTKKYKKRYTKSEFKYRLKVFTDNLMRIRLLNTYEQGSAWYGVTKFADLTHTEFSASLGLRPDLRNENEPPFARADIPDVELPTEFDWRTKGAVTGVKNQEQCGSCWAFSVTGNVEGQYAIKHGNLLEFSEQELVDCDTEDQGCNGGLMDTAYRQIEKLGGLESEQDYPYDAEDEKCHFNRTLARVQLTGALNISHNETDMAKWLVANGPISIAINANAMQFYMGGVSHPFKFLCSPNNLDHGVLIVGYGVHTYPLFKKSLPYWTVKNSWGTSWGEQGYYRVYRGDGTCGLNQTPSSAIVA